MKKILIIEDNQEIRENSAELLELSNYKVFTAENGKVGVEKAIEHEPDLIVCDIMMPVLDGYGVLHTIHKNDRIRNTPFIMLTAMSERNEMRKGMEMGADDYITKPFTPTELLNAIEGRLKKVASLKEEFSPGISGFDSIIQTTLGQDQIASLTEDHNINKYKRKQLIYSEGNHPNRLYYLVKGKVKTYRTNDEGKEFITELFTEGDFVGYLALIENTGYKDTAAAMCDSEIAVIPREKFDNLLNNNREVMQKFIRLLANNVSSKEEQLLKIAYNSLRKKVADAILKLQRKYHQNTENDFSIDINRENLANIAGTAKESLIRTLSDFRNENLINMKDDGSLVVTNQLKLEKMIN